jgi:hypothetical protein
MTAAEILDGVMNGTIVEDDALVAAEAPEQDAGTTDAQADTQPDTQPDAQPDAQDDAEPVAPILSKSGAYTIPYQKLADARAERDALRAQVAQLQQHLDGLSTTQQQNIATAQSEAVSRADAGQSQTEADANLAAATDAVMQGADVALFGDFSEESIAKGVAELTRRSMDQLRAEFRESMAKDQAAKSEQEAALAQQSAHESAILQAHPDAYELAESAEFEAWSAALPAYARAGIAHALTQGTTQEVIEVLDAFQASRTTQGIRTHSPEATKRRMPATLSEIPGAAPTDDIQQTLAMAGNPNALIERMSGMTPEQVDALMNRI